MVHPPEKREEWLLTYAETCSVKKACEIVGINRRTVYGWRKRYPEFAELYECAREQAVDTLEDEAVRRARDGIEKTIYYQGIAVDTVIEYSDALLQFLLRGLKPDVYGNKQQISMSDVATPPERVKTADDRKRLLKLVKNGSTK